MHAILSAPLYPLLNKLSNVKQTKPDQWMACCPAHDDRKQSLGVAVGPTGKLLLNCLAGCELPAVLKAIPAEYGELFPRVDPRSLDTLQSSAAGTSSRSGKARIVATYDYLAADGSLLFQVVRFDPKDFKQRRRDPAKADGWLWNMKGVDKVLYRLPAILTTAPNDRIYLVEGEKDADRLVSYKLNATTVPGGAGKWNKSYGESLRGRHVVLIPDVDRPSPETGKRAGWEHVVKVANELIGVAESVRVLELPNDATIFPPEQGGPLVPKWDVSDWIDRGIKCLGPQETGRRFHQAVNAAPLWQRTETTKPEATGAAGTAGEAGASAGSEIASLWDKTDLGNAERFARLNGDRFRYVAMWKVWHVWDGKRWKADTTQHHNTVYRETVIAEMFVEAAKSLKDNAFDYPRTCCSRSRIDAALKLAESCSGMAITPDLFDSDPWALNCLNGTIDLRTGTLRPHRQTDYLTTLSPTAFDPDASSYLWDKFIETIFGGSLPVIEFVQRLFGYFLTGVVTEQRLPFFWGSGANGKSTLLEVVQRVLGSDFVTTAARDLLMAKRGENHLCEIADLFGKRLVICAESDDGRSLAEGQLKALTGGDRIKARRMRENPWEFDPTHKLLLVTNHLPRVRGTDHGIWRRLLLIPFEQQFWNPDAGEVGPDELRQDKTISKRILAEPEGVLAWMVRGCLEWQRQGLNPPPEVLAATEDYRSREDHIGEFLAECCLTAQGNGNFKVKAADLLDAYRDWCDRMGEQAMNGTRFGRTIGERFERLRSNGIWYTGITLRADLPSKRDSESQPTWGSN